MLANRLALDAQGRLVLRENGKIVLPYEHFANAVMLKHMTGPHGLHLSLEATIRSVVESYTIGRENFGMEKEFIVEVVQSCPNPACRYFKTHLPTGQNYMDPAAFQSAVGNQSNVDFMQHLSQISNPQTQSAMMQSQQPPTSSHIATANTSSSIIDMTQLDSSSSVKSFPQPMQAPQQATHQMSHQRSSDKQMKYNSAQQHQLTAAIIQQQNRAIAQQNLEKFGNMSQMEKQRVLQQLDKKQFDPSMLHVTENRSSHDRSNPSHLPSRSPQLMSAPSPLDLQQHKANDFSTKPPVEVSLLDSPTNKDLLALHNGAWSAYQPQNIVRESPTNNLNIHHTMSSSSQQQTIPSQPKSQTNYPQSQPSPSIGQENVVRVFDELMKNMARMKQYIRPSMCKPYGKQSETLQKS